MSKYRSVSLQITLECIPDDYLMRINSLVMLTLASKLSVELTSTISLTQSSLLHTFTKCKFAKKLTTCICPLFTLGICRHLWKNNASHQNLIFILIQAIRIEMCWWIRIFTWKSSGYKLVNFTFALLIRKSLILHVHRHVIMSKSQMFCAIT